MSLRARMLYTEIKSRIPCRVRVSGILDIEKIYIVSKVYMKDDMPNALYLKDRHTSYYYLVYEERILEVMDYELESKDAL